MELSTVDHSHWEKGDESKEVLRRGQTDTFKFAIKSLRNLTHVTLGHRRRQGSVVKGTGKETGWFLHEVIVTNPETGEK